MIACAPTKRRKGACVCVCVYKLSTRACRGVAAHGRTELDAACVTVVCARGGRRLSRVVVDRRWYSTDDDDRKVQKVCVGGGKEYRGARQRIDRLLHMCERTRRAVWVVRQGPSTSQEPGALLLKLSHLKSYHTGGRERGEPMARGGGGGGGG